MKRMVFLLSLVVLQIVLWGCTSAPNDLLEKKVGVMKGDGPRVPEPYAPTLKEFISTLKPGKWEKVDNDQWIYRTKSTDSLSKKTTEASMLFVKYPNRQDVVVLQRLIVDGDEVTDSNLLEFILIAAADELSKANQKSQTSVPSPAQPQTQPSNEQPQQSAKPEKNNDTAVEQSGICKGLDLSITAEQLECLDRKYSAADKELNILYKQKMAGLDESKKSALKKEQIAWIKEKESKCAQAGKEMEGGTLETVMIKDCTVQMTEQRVAFLKSIK